MTYIKVRRYFYKSLVAILASYVLCNSATADHNGTPYHTDLGLTVPGSSSGTYTVSWMPVGGTDLQEKKDGGSYTTVYSGNDGSFDFANKASGTYTYRIRWVYCIWGCFVDYTLPESVVVSAPPPLQPEPLTDQLEYLYDIRTGDFDGNGHVDLLVDRMSPGNIDGSMQTVIVEGDVSGPTVTVPTTAELDVARSFPANPDIILGGTDQNFDGYADIIIAGLDALNSPSYPIDDLILYASARSGVAQPMGLRFIDDQFGKFFDNMGQAMADPQFYVNNTNVSVTPVYGVTIHCPFQFSTDTYSLWDCKFDVVIVDFEVQVTGIGYHPNAPDATEAIDAIAADDYSNGDPWKRLSDALKSVLGVNSFGYQDDGSRLRTNYLPESGEILDELDQAYFTFIFQIPLFIDIEITELSNPNDWPRHEYDVGTPGIGTSICSTTGDTVYNDGLAGPMAPPAIRTIPQAICTLDNVFCWAKRRPAPRANDSSATVQPGIPTVLTGGNPIRTHVFPNARVLVNETIGDNVVAGVSAHVLHDPLQSTNCANFSDFNTINSTNPRCSYVHREVFMNGSSINVRTHGEGHNPFPLDTVNEIAGGNIIFPGVDQWIRRRMATDGACSDDP